MNEEKKALSEFLELKQFRYANRAGVIFYRMADGSLYVAAGHPGVEKISEISLDFYEQFDHLIHFMTLLHINDPACLADVVPEDLFLLYKCELLDIVCTLKGRKDLEMSFRKLDGIIWASNTQKKMHQVRKNVNNPDDLIAYTKQYYKFIDN